MCALRDLGIEASELPHSEAPVCVLSDPVHCDTPVVTNALDGVVAVLATPPNSYSAVTDPIDLVCGRGGDLAMLEVRFMNEDDHTRRSYSNVNNSSSFIQILTESEVDTNGKARVQSILEEQKKTLKTLLSKPQVMERLSQTNRGYHWITILNFLMLS